MTIRLATKADIPAMMDIYNQAIVRQGITADLIPKTLENREAWFAEHENDEQHPLFAYVNEAGMVVGYGYLGIFIDREGYDQVAELSYYFDNAAQGQGYGTKMVDWLINKALDLHYRKLIAIVAAGNVPSGKILSKFDFTKKGLLPEIMYTGTQFVDVEYWYLDISDRIWD